MNRRRPGGWVALAWRYFRDEKFLAVSADAELLYCHALAFAGEGETDGRIPAAALGLLATKLVGPALDAAAELVDVGLWEPDGRNYRVHAWERWQPTASQARAARERDAKRKALARANADICADSAGTSARTTPATGAGAGAGHSPTSPAPWAERERNPSPEPTRLGWDTYTDAAGRLFARPVNGQGDPEPEP